MAFHCTIDVPRKLAICTLSGSVTSAEIAEATEAMYRDPGWQLGFDLLYDGTRITELLFEKDGLQTIASTHAAHAELAGPGVNVILVSRALDHAMAQMYAQMTKNQRRTTYVCQSAAEAWRRLGRERF